MPSSGCWPFRWCAALLIAAAAALRIAYLAFDCPLDLAPDEAQYWDWSRHLDWSYYSKGPLVAWLIRLSCWLLGDWSRAVTGSEMLAVRLPAVLCGSLLLASLYVLTVQVWRREGLALAVVAIALTLPLINAGASLMTIDAPYACCWGWALVFGHRAIFGGSAAAWIMTGLFVGVGILAKYALILWIPSAALFLFFSPMHRRLIGRRGFWSMCVVAALCCLPILVWNLQNDWITLRHMSGHAGMNEPTRVRWFGPAVYLGQQAALLLGYWFLAWLAAMIAYRPGQAPTSEVAYLWWLSAPTWLFFALFSLKNGGGQANWPVTAYLSGLVLVAGWLAEQLGSSAAVVRRRIAWCGVFTFSAIGLFLSVLAHDSSRLWPVLAPLAGTPTATNPCPLRRLDPTCRLRGWRALAAEVDRVREELRRRGIEPVLAANHWTLPGELAFYCQGQPTVFAVGAPHGDRHSQYDLWRPNPVTDESSFAGRTFLIVGVVYPYAFEQCLQAGHVTHYERGYPIAEWKILIGHGFRGFRDLRKSGPIY